MALYVDEEEIWKCPKHPFKRRRTGICHVCLRERLSSLCPDCANARPCACYATTASSSSGYSSFSSSSHRFSSAAVVGSVGRVSNLIGSEPSFRRSRSVAVPFLRSKPSADQSYNSHKTSSSFWSLFKGGHGNRSMTEEVDRRHVVILKEEEDESARKVNEDEERRKMMRKSRSVAVTSDSRGSDVMRSSKGGKGWFPSPIKIFKQSISRGILVHERSPLYRG
ncbi:PREDICTED: uncharacterized protein LOC105128276 [Populus euphratica]|uniref:Uncharacterized protein LOC105128276 n=1 Tax=Populus euphratica TaxID=75702 RepID=A0AAJ6UF16_POPEU|nr:PREDICTED: uncharacterized protein LOC105128276 [Populus euphratica]